jgi:hypothetical protein
MTSGIDRGGIVADDLVISTTGLSTTRGAPDARAPRPNGSGSPSSRSRLAF